MKSLLSNKQPWLHQPVFDGLFILLPGFMALFITLLLPAQYKNTDEMPIAGWIILVLLIDVAHVYSTLFRTYWDNNRFAQHKVLYITVPVLCYVGGVLLYTINPMIFWRVLAYLAVFHFIRQQYGFMRLYSRLEHRKNFSTLIDTITIYSATLYPLIYWHCTPNRNFSWFIDGDFLILNASALSRATQYIYLLILITYVSKEVLILYKTRYYNIPKNLVVAGTALTWYAGIVYFNGDMAFTLLNVVAHGIPYMALIWVFRQKEQSAQANNSKTTYSPKHTLAFFIVSIILFAYIEEGLWDGLVWRERPQIFSFFSVLPSVSAKEILALLIPLLSLPQTTHYVLDGFIWKKEKKQEIPSPAK